MTVVAGDSSINRIKIPEMSYLRNTSATSKPLSDKIRGGRPVALSQDRVVEKYDGS